MIYSFVPPFEGFHKNGRTRKRTLRKYIKHSGIYFIRENGIIVYVGMSESCVVEACYRHFYPWRDCYRGMGCEYRTTYVNKLEEHTYEIAILHLQKEQVVMMERALIFSLKPRDNRFFYEDYFIIKADLDKVNQDQEAEWAEPDDVPF